MASRIPEAFRPAFWASKKTGSLPVARNIASTGRAARALHQEPAKRRCRRRLGMPPARTTGPRSGGGRRPADFRKGARAGFCDASAATSGCQSMPQPPLPAAIASASHRRRAVRAARRRSAQSTTRIRSRPRRGGADDGDPLALVQDLGAEEALVAQRAGQLPRRHDVVAIAAAIVAARLAIAVTAVSIPSGTAAATAPVAGGLRSALEALRRGGCDGDADESGSKRDDLEHDRNSILVRRRSGTAPPRCRME